MKENLILNLDNKDKLVDICKALSSPVRLDIPVSSIVVTEKVKKINK